MATATTPATLARIEARVYRVPVAEPVVTSFGVMRDRPALFVRIEDDAGRVGWGEAWCNFPAVGAEHRARLVDSVLAPLLLGRRIDAPAEVFDDLGERTAVLALQCGEGGPFAQTIAAVDIALCDLAAQRAGQPLWRWLGGRTPAMSVYASGINPHDPVAVVRRQRAAGHRAFKLKLGFGHETDLANLRALRNELRSGETLFADANQAWSLDEALARVGDFEPFGLGWLEEPLRADRPWPEWHRLAAATRTPLAAGENIAGAAHFDAALRAGALAVVQPDLAKWGGFSGNLPVARAVQSAGRRLCPHYLGAGIGLLASAHWLAAIGGDGRLEIDSNPNPLRDALCGRVAEITDGRIELDESPGLGLRDVDALLAPFEGWRRTH